MRVGLNLLYLLPGIVGGTETYAAGLLRGLSTLNTQDELVVFVNRESAQWRIPPTPNFIKVICPVSAASRGMRYFFEQFRLPGLLRQHRIELVHSLGYVGPLQTSCPSVVTIPDLNYIALKHTMPLLKRMVLHFFSQQSARRANHIITISNFSKKELCEGLHLDPQRITVTHLGPRERSGADSGEVPELARTYGIRQPYVVSLGGGSVHKNTSRLIEAFAKVKEEFPHNLVLVGHIPASLNLQEEVRSKGLGSRFNATGYVPDAHVIPILSHADLFVLPSLYEGFGLPVLEAQQAGVAVACSTAGSLPEVAGDGAAFFDPQSVQSIAQTIRRCLLDADLRAELRRLGKENVGRFSWEKTARETLAVYHHVVSSCTS